MLEFRILGPVEVRRDTCTVQLNGRKVRAVLAALLLRANHVVLIDRLVAALWGDRPPATAVAQLHKYVSQLRGQFGQDCIVRQGDGYRLHLGRNVLDLHVFDQTIRSARASLAAGRPVEAAEEIAAALALWRGEPIANATEDLIRTEAAALEERRLAAVLDRIEIELALGRHAELISELQTLAADHPLHEKLRAHLMLALYRSGRVAEALTAYHDGRVRLAEELGLDPGTDLQQLHEAILVGDPNLHLAQSATEPVRAPASPAQLPPSIADFTGRAAEVALVCHTVTAAPGDALPIVAIAGKGGVGKSTLALRAARRVVDAFPDGQLYARLRSPDGQPVDPLVVLQRFLRALGVEEWVIPDDLDECTHLFRSRSAAQRLLVVLDDAADAAQVRCLLPGSPTCAVIVTSRPRLAGLEGARVVDLDVFDCEESVELLARIAGTRWDGDDQATAREIGQLCGHLPLAVRIAAARFAQHGPGQLRHLARRLADERRRLDLLVAGDLEVRTSLAVSYQGLGPAERRAFALLGLLDAPDFAAWVVAPLLEVTVQAAEDIVEELVNAQLLDIVGYDGTGQARYRYHDLVRLYARECGEATHREQHRRRALCRAYGAWLTLAAEAGARLHGTRHRGWSSRRFADSAYHDPFDPVDVDDLLEHPLRWFEAERAALVACAAQAGTSGSSSLAWALAESITDFLELRHHYGDWESSHVRALNACLADGNLVGVAVMMLRLARLRFIRKEPGACRALVDRALTLLADLGEKAIEAEARVMYASVLRADGDHEGALAQVDEALVLARALSNSLAETQAARELGTIRYELSEWAPAADAFRSAVHLAHRLDNRREEALSLRYLAVVLRHQGRLEEARRAAESALAVFHGLGDRPYQAFSCLTLGMVLLALGDPSARRFVEEGQGLLQEMNLGFGVGETLYVRAALDVAEGRAATAAGLLFDAIRILAEDPVHHVLLAAVGLLAHALRLSGDDAAADAVERRTASLPAMVGRRLPPGALAADRLVGGREDDEKDQGTGYA